MKTQIEKYLKLKEELEAEADKAHNLISAYVKKAQQLYWESERLLHTKYGYGYSITMYDLLIPFQTYDAFHVHSVKEDYIEISCDYNDMDGENFNWLLRLPCDQAKLPEYIATWEKNREEFTINKIAAKDAKKKERRRKEFGKLIKEFG